MRRWEQLRPEFTALGVDFVAISPDTPAELARFMAKQQLQMRVLSDGDLKVTTRYNLHYKTLAMGPGRKRVRPLAIPTTILVDAEGIVRWIDQADDFRVRSDASRVLGHVREALGEPAASPRA